MGPSTRLVQAHLGNRDIFIDAVVQPGTEPTSASEEVAGRVLQAFDSAKDVISDLAERVSDSVTALAEQAASPEEFTVEFGLSVTTTGSVILASASTAATLAITLTYKCS